MKFENVGSGTALKLVATRATLQCVIARSTDELVGPVAA